MADVNVRMVTIVEEARPGHTRAQIVAVDDRIIIDSYDASWPDCLWYCDNCGKGFQVTAQFKIPDIITPDSRQFITLCETCCQNAVNGIRYSYANPVKDGAA